MQVKNQVAYHIHRIGKYDEYWKEGNEITFGNTETNLEKHTNETRIEYEDSFEEIRKVNYNTSPSRNTCLFVCNKENIVSWFNNLTRINNNSKLKQFKIFEVELNGNLFWADASIYEDYWNKNEVTSIVDYWEGKINQKDKVEGLFVGHVRIIAEHEPKDFDVQLTKVVTVKITTPTEKVNNGEFFDFDNY